MAVKIKAGQAQLEAPKKDLLKGKVKTPLLAIEEVAAVDRMVELHETLSPHFAAFKEYEEKKKFLAQVALDRKRFEPEKEVVLEGTSGYVEYKPESNPPREIKDMHGLIAELKKKLGGYENLLGILKINLGDVDNYLTEPERQPFIGQGEKGNRSLKGVRSK